MNKVFTFWKRKQNQKIASKRYMPNKNCLAYIKNVIQKVQTLLPLLITSRDNEKYIIRILILYIALMSVNVVDTIIYKAKNNYNKELWVCWVVPPVEVLNKCKNNCLDLGIEGWGGSKEVAIKKALKLCKKEYKTYNCEIEYCDEIGL